MFVLQSNEGQYLTDGTFAFLGYSSPKVKRFQTRKAAERRAVVVAKEHGVLCEVFDIAKHQAQMEQLWKKEAKANARRVRTAQEQYLPFSGTLVYKAEGEPRDHAASLPIHFLIMKAGSIRGYVVTDGDKIATVDDYYDELTDYRYVPQA